MTHDPAEREKFEKFAREKNWLLDHESGFYTYMAVQRAWEGWQAALASRQLPETSAKQLEPEWKCSHGKKEGCCQTCSMSWPDGAAGGI